MISLDKDAAIHVQLANLKKSVLAMTNQNGESRGKQPKLEVINVESFEEFIKAVESATDTLKKAIESMKKEIDSLRICEEDIDFN